LSTVSEKTVIQVLVRSSGTSRYRCKRQ